MRSSFIHNNCVPDIASNKIGLSNVERKLLDLYGGVAYDHEAMPKIVAVHSLYLDPINPPQRNQLSYMLPKQSPIRETAANTPQETEFCQNRRNVISLKSGAPFFKSHDFGLPERTLNQCHFCHGKSCYSQPSCTLPSINGDINFVKYQVQPQHNSGNNMLECYPDDSQYSLNVSSKETITEDFQNHRKEKTDDCDTDYDLATASSSDSTSSDEDFLNAETIAETNFERESPSHHSKKNSTVYTSQKTETLCKENVSKTDETECSASIGSVSNAPTVSTETLAECNEAQEQSPITQTGVQKTASFGTESFKVRIPSKGKLTLFDKVSILTRSGYSISSALCQLNKKAAKQGKDAMENLTSTDDTILTEEFLRNFALMEKLKRQKNAKLRITPEQKETTCAKRNSETGSELNEKTTKNTAVTMTTTTLQTLDEIIDVKPQPSKEQMTPVMHECKKDLDLAKSEAIVEASHDSKGYPSIQQDLIRQCNVAEQELMQGDSKLEELRKNASDRLNEERETCSNSNAYWDFEQNADTTSYVTPLSNIANAQHHLSAESNHHPWKNTTVFDPLNVGYTHIDSPSASCVPMTDSSNLPTKPSEEMSLSVAVTSDSIESYPKTENTLPKLTIRYFPTKDDIERARRSVQSQNTVSGESKDSLQSLEKSPSEPCGLKRNSLKIEDKYPGFQTKRPRKSVPRKLCAGQTVPAEPRHHDCNQDTPQKERYSPTNKDADDVSFNSSSEELSSYQAPQEHAFIKNSDLENTTEPEHFRQNDGTTHADLHDTETFPSVSEKTFHVPRQNMDTSDHQWCTSSTPPLPEPACEQHYTIKTSLDREERIKTLLAKQTHLLSKIMNGERKTKLHDTL